MCECCGGHKNEETAILKVEGMTCSHCKMAVEKALRNVPGVQDATVDLTAKTAKISYDPKSANRSKLVEAITAAGYTVPN